MKIKYKLSNDPRVTPIDSLIKTKFKSLVTETNPDIVLVAGGDGALLHSIQQFNHFQVPFLGIACGTLNFLMNQIEDISKFIDKLIHDQINLQTLETTSIKAEINSNNKKKLIGFAVNEIILGTAVMGYHHLSISSTDSMFNNFEIKGTGICVATDLGSTAYNFNLGGSVLPIGSNLWSVMGIVCNRFLEDIITIQNLEIKNLSKSNVNIFLDGISNKAVLNQNDSLLLSRGEIIKIAFLDQKDFLRRRMEISSRYRK